jgi:hypothetical protein
MLSHIMQMRESSPSVSSDDEDDEEDDGSSGRDDKESIQIMLRRSGYYPESNGTSSDNAEEHDYSRCSEDRQRWSLSSWSSCMQERQVSGTSSVDAGEHSPTEGSSNDHGYSQVERLSVPAAQRLLVAQVASGNAPTPEEEVETPMGLSSHRHSTNTLRINMNLLQQYPDLVKQAKWNPKRATQLYLQQLAKNGLTSPRLSEPDTSGYLSVPEFSPPPVPQDKRRLEADTLTEEAVVVPESKDVPDSDYTEHRASLNLRDDWEQASPSIADWMHLAAADTTPITSPQREGAETPRFPPPAAAGRAIEGLGLCIHVQSPQDDDSPTIPAPPLPDYAPPPPPVESEGHTGYEHLEPSAQAHQISPSIYSANPPSSSLANGPFQPHDYGQTNRSSGSSSVLQQVGPSPSPQTLASSATSQAEQVVPEPPVPKSSSPTPEQRRLKKRNHVIKELVDTEYTFGQDMTVVVDIYKGTSSSCLDLSAEDVKTLFGNSEHIVKFCLDFQDSLKQAAKSVYVLPKSQRWRSRRGSRFMRMSNLSGADQQVGPETTDDRKDRETFVGRAFMDNIERMEKVYSDYLKNHDAANKKLEILQKNKKVNIWLKECREWASDLTTAWNLDSLLVKPVQRILKYPLLLTELLSATPTDHPDHAAIANALRETTAISVRINEMKKRADVVCQVVSNRKRKESDVRAGLSKAFGRRTEKLKQHVGLTETFTDKEFDTLAQRFGDNFFQLQLIMRDAELYVTEVQNAVGKFNDFILAIEAYITVAPSNYPELESKWCRFKLAVKDVVTVALADHVSEPFY